MATGKYSNLLVFDKIFCADWTCDSVICLIWLCADIYTWLHFSFRDASSLTSCAILRDTLQPWCVPNKGNRVDCVSSDRFLGIFRFHTSMCHNDRRGFSKVFQIGYPDCNNNDCDESHDKCDRWCDLDSVVVCGGGIVRLHSRWHDPSHKVSHYSILCAEESNLYFGLVLEVHQSSVLSDQIIEWGYPQHHLAMKSSPENKHAGSEEDKRKTNNPDSQPDKSRKMGYFVCWMTLIKRVSNYRH